MAVTTPEQLAADFEGRFRDRRMPRAERAAIFGSPRPSPFMAVVEERAITHGTVRLSGGYPGTPVYGGEIVLDHFLIRTTRPMREAAG